MIIGLAGYARSGKDEVAKVLVNKYGFTRVAFADPIREFLLKINPILDDGHRVEDFVKEFDWNIAKAKPETRRLLQDIGITAREMFGEDFWIGLALRKMEYKERVVVTDVRFRNEINAIHTLEGKVFRVMREGVGPVNGHISETDVDNAYVDGYIQNNGTLEDLEGYVDQMMSSYAYKIV